jgi:hypothetical protein
MKHVRIVFLISLMMVSWASLAQKSQTITLSGDKARVEEVADSSLVYLFPALEQALITLSNGTTYMANINYNILGDAMQIQTRRGLQTLDPLQLSQLEVAGSTFIYHRDEGYLEVLFKGKFPLYKKRGIQVSAVPVVRGAYGSKDYTSSIDQASYIQTGPRGEFYLLNNSGQEIDITLRYDEFFLIGKGDNLVKISNQRQLLRDFPEYRNELRDYLRKENTDFSNPEDLDKLVGFLESLN